MSCSHNRYQVESFKNNVLKKNLEEEYRRFRLQFQSSNILTFFYKKKYIQTIVSLLAALADVLFLGLGRGGWDIERMRTVFLIWVFHLEVEVVTK